MATVFPYPDSRALISVAIGARVGVYSMSNSLSRAMDLIRDDHKLAATVAMLNAIQNTPPPALRDIVRAIESRRGVTLAKG